MRTAAGVFAAALAARLAFWRLQGTLPLVGDALEYDAFARSLVEAGVYLGPHGEAASRMPGYPLFLAGLRLAFGGSPEAVIAAQCLLGAVTCVLLLDLARRFMPEGWAVACGLVAAGYHGMIAPAAYPASEALYGFFLVLSVWALHHPAWKPLRRAVSFAALSACLYLVRPEPLPYILLTIVCLPYLWAKFSRKEVLSALAVFAMITGLWVGRNFVIFRRVVPASSVGQNVKYLSLLLPAEQQGLAPQGRYEAPSSLGELEREQDMARAYRELAGRLTWPQIVKSYLFNLASILYPFLPGYDWTYVALVPFFLLGLREAARRKELRPMAAAVLCSISVFIFFGGPASRYRQGISPLVVLLAVAGMHAAAAAAGAARFRVWAGGWVAANLAVWIFSAQTRELALFLKGVLWRH
jgi:4-amino-4-deoxy-L-arabinose transferase-like glycosyltransferase